LFWQDLRFAVRMLRKDLPVTLAAVTSLALGIGFNTSLFTFLDAVLLRPIPVHDPARLVSVVSVDNGDSRYLPNSRPNYLDLRDQNTVFSDLTSFQALQVRLSLGERSELILGQIVSGNYFDVLGIKPLLGRTFLPEDDQVMGARPVVVLGHSLWQKSFGSDPRIVGRDVRLNGQRFTVIGVTPKDFRGTGRFTVFKFWVPMMMSPAVFPLADHLNDRDWRLFRVVGRLKPGISAARAESEVKTISHRLALAHPRENHDQTATIVPFMHEALGPNSRALFVRAGALLMTIASLLLLGACANVANLLLSRAAGRRQEMAIRMAAGASRSRIFRQLLTESILLSMLGGGLGMLIAHASREVFLNIKNPLLSADALDLSLDSRILVYALGISLLTGVLFGLAPAFQAFSTDPALVLKGAAGLQPRGRKLLGRNALVGLQVAISFISLVAAGWFLRSVNNARQADPGLEVDHLFLISFDLTTLNVPPAEGLQIMERMITTALGTPGVVSASGSQKLLFSGIGLAQSVAVEGQANEKQGPLVETNGITLDYFATTGGILLAGRSFQPGDGPGSMKVAVVNESMAKRYWPGESGFPLGRRFRLDEDPDPITIVGVVRDNRMTSATESPRPFIYLPMTQHYAPGITLFVRVARPSAGLVSLLRGRVQAINRELPIELETGRSRLDQSLWASHAAAGILSVLGTLALVLAALGVASLVAYEANRRRFEIGVRLALGAPRPTIAKLVALGSLGVILAGMAIGLGVTSALGSAVSGLLFKVSATDPWVLGGTGGLLILVALAANIVPIWRAVTISPTSTLRGR
jgi:predicted permease